MKTATARQQKAWLAQWRFGAAELKKRRLENLAHLDDNSARHVRYVA